MIQLSPPLLVLERSNVHIQREMKQLMRLVRTKHFFLAKVDGKVLLKTNHKYYFQVQGSLGIPQLKWSDFVVYTKKDLHVERIFFDNELWEKTMLPELTGFYFEYVFPQIKL